uniref:Odorant receptor n=1 Tax=Dendrolimus kikuchii TaxID=765133 RepID=A0A076E7L4_9NEOP|nr:odorant receptor [Dendrolimus kikuchii]
MKPHFAALARVAYYKIVSAEVTDLKRSFHNAYRVIIFTLVAGYNIQHIIKAIQVRHNVDHMVDTLFILLTTINTFAKQISFNVRSHRVENLINIINSPTFAPQNEDHVQILKNNASIMSRLLKVYHFAVLICGGLWTIFPFVNRALGQEVRFTGYIPFDTTDSPNFEIAEIYMSILIILQAYANVTLDCTIVAFYSLAKTQIELLRYNYEHFVDFNRDSIVVSNKIIRYNEENERKYLQKRFVNSVKHYQKIVWFAKETESIFAEAMVVQFSTSSWVICMTVYKIVGLNIFSMEFVSIAVYLGCMLAQIFLYCYYGTELAIESDFINQSIYSGDWLSLSPRFRKQLLVMMQFCTRPIAPRIAIVIPMSLETYISILRCSYTLFTFLNRK